MKKIIEKDKVHKGINLLTWSTSVRWFGWGLGEAFIPIFLLLFSENFLETGLLTSVYNIVFFLSIPLAGYLADNIKIKKILLFGLILYVFIGMGYFLAGLTSSIIFIIIARGLNGIAYSFDQVGRESYFIRNSPKNKISKIFGRFDVITNFWWIIAVIIGITLVKFMSIPIHWLLFVVTPTSIISLLIVSRLKERPRKYETNLCVLKTYLNLPRDIKKFKTELKITILLSFITGILSSIIYFFVPIFAYLNGDGLGNSAVLALVYAIPMLFGKFLGKIADKKKEKIYFISFLSIILILGSLILVKNYFLLLIIMFTASIIFELISLTNRGILARFADRTHLGEIDGSLNGFAALGAIVGPLLFGFLLDSTSIANSYFVIIIIAMIASIISFFGIKKYFKTN